ncbi:glycoside hydrolase family 97 protein [Pedobacter sp. MC2016-24]|uniref:glycoside hydrolase family 97 protein n=1 Tax=Pedobacter sp. MC2016-24 TaxID=2780090 RepID=UPI0018818DCD|nr:glycoside hydrolase family 97 protein [Pedobacter sp. MC2016-24]MBE9599818.1 glycoside hydrolase family 97 catalytic domain-containing protein [Pedobacter sp. MC2016-24]
MKIFTPRFSQLFLLLLLFNRFNSFAQHKATYQVYSPDKYTAATFSTDSEGTLKYMVSYDGKTVVDWSDLGLKLQDAVTGKNIVIGKVVQKKYVEKFKWQFGEREFIESRFQEMILSCSSEDFKFDVTIRLFNGSLAFKYVIPKQKKTDFVIEKELTAFNFPDPYLLYQYHHESVFTPTMIDSLRTNSDFPVTLSNGNLFLMIGEANNTSYTKAELQKGEGSNSLVVSFAQDKNVKFSEAFDTPWRTISFSKSAIGLHQYSDLFLKLSPAPSLKLAAGIKPGKLIRSDLNTQAGLDCIDLAHKMNFKYIMFDAGWYGPERSVSSDPRLPIEKLDLKKVIKYGEDRGVGVLLYVNYIALQNHLDEILPLYKKWGIAGMKFGFVDGFTQKGLTWLSGAIKKVNDYGLVLNIHDNYKPTGLSRTYPSLFSQEGIRGDENGPDAFHNTTLPYTRFLAGAADFTFCFPNPKNNFTKNLKVSKAQQLALTVVYYSPLQAIFWYGKPNDYTNENEIEFFKYVPTVWDETHYVSGEIGKSVCVARRSAATWYLGNAAGLTDWKQTIKLDFLDAKKRYNATVYEDDGNGGISKRSLRVKKGDVFSIEIKAKGGQAMIISPV